MPSKVYVTNYPAGDFRAMPAIGAGHALLKWVTSFPGNPARGLPTVTGLVLVSDAEDGQLAGAARRGAVTALRTGAAAVLAAETLGRADARDGLGDRCGRQRPRRRGDVRCTRPAGRAVGRRCRARARGGRRARRRGCGVARGRSGGRPGRDGDAGPRGPARRGNARRGPARLADGRRRPGQGRGGDRRAGARSPLLRRLGAGEPRRRARPRRRTPAPWAATT